MPGMTCGVSCRRNPRSDSGLILASLLPGSLNSGNTLLDFSELGMVSPELSGTVGCPRNCRGWSAVRWGNMSRIGPSGVDRGVRTGIRYAGRPELSDYL